MNLEAMRRHADNPVWHDEEESRFVYRYPLPLVPPEGSTWLQIAERANLTRDIPSGERYELGPFPCAKSPQSHIGPFLHAVDFLVPDGTLVLAAQDGDVVELIEHNTRWGASQEFRDKLNFITIAHASGEFSQYCHFAKDSVAAHSIRIGSRVKVGQPIAIVGKTGWTDRDHLHFVIFRSDRGNPANPFGFKSLRPRFV